MTTPLPSRTFGLPTGLLRRLAAAALLCLLAQGAAAQDTDDDSILPFTGSTPSGECSPPGSGGGSSQSLTTDSSVLVAGELQDEIDPARATIQFGTSGESTPLVTEAPVDQAAFVADPPGIAAGEGPSLQGSGLLHLFEGLQARFVAAQASTQSVAVLVIAKDGPALEAELAGTTQPELVLPLGATASVDLVKFAAVTARFAELLPGYHATVVFASVQAGELHTAAVRAHTEGGPLEVLMR